MDFNVIDYVFMVILMVSCVVLSMASRYMFYKRFKDMFDNEVEIKVEKRDDK